jgi:WD40 repeat protein
VPSCSLDGNCSVTLWNAATGARVRTLPEGNAVGLNTLALSPDGRLLATSDAFDAHGISLRNATTGTLIDSLTGTLTAINNSGFHQVTALAFSPDGQILAAGYEDGTIQLWNPATRAPIGSPLPATGWSITGLAFSTDSGMLISTDTVHVTPWPLWQFANPYTALCDEVGPPPASVWEQYAPGEPEPAGTCAGVPPASAGRLAAPRSAATRYTGG